MVNGIPALLINYGNALVNIMIIEHFLQRIDALLNQYILSEAFPASNGLNLPPKEEILKHYILTQNLQ